MTETPDLTCTDRNRLGVSTYELWRDRIRCRGHYSLGHTFDVQYALGDLRPDAQVYGQRHPWFPSMLNLTTLLLFAGIVCQRLIEDPHRWDLPWICWSLAACFAVVAVWAFPRMQLRTYLLHDYRPAFSVRIAPETRLLIEAIDAGIRRHQQSDHSQGNHT